MKKSSYASIAVSGKTILITFEDEHEAKVWAEIFQDPKIGMRYNKVEVKGKEVHVEMKSAEEAKILAVLMAPDSEDYKHPLETQGKRCPRCES